MVKACCVAKCSSGVTIPAYRFPSDVKCSESWAIVIQCPEILKLTTTERRKYRVCYKHFDEETSFLCSAQRKRLKNDAIPTLHLPVQSEKMEYADITLVSATPLGNEDSNHEEMIITDNEEAAWEINEHNEAGPSTSSGQRSTPQKSRSVLLRVNLEKCQLTPKAAKVYNNINKLMKRNRYVHRRNEDLKARLKEATALSESSLINRFENLSTTQRMFI